MYKSIIGNSVLSAIVPTSCKKENTVCKHNYIAIERETPCTTWVSINPFHCGLKEFKDCGISVNGEIKYK